MADDVMVDDVSIDEKDQKDVIKDAPSKSKDEANENHSQQDGADKSVDSNADSKKQFDPEKFRKEAFKQASDWKRKYEDLEGRFSKLESTYTQKLESLVGMMTPKQESSLSDQDKMSLVQLFKMGMQVPEIADMLGINKHQNLEKELQSERQARMEREFDSELESVIGKWTQSYGLNSDEMKQELLDFISSNEIYGKKDYRRGLLQEAAKSLYFDRMAELQQRKANLDIIKDQQEKKKSGTESPSKGKPGEKSKVETNMKDFLDRRIREEGGEISFD